MSEPNRQSTVDDVFDALGGPAAFARGLTEFGSEYGVSCKSSAAGEMKRRRKIPVEYWIPLTELATARGASWITYEALAFIHAKKNPQPKPLTSETV